jgi:hypothetical protein
MLIALSKLGEYPNAPISLPLTPNPLSPGEGAFVIKERIGGHPQTPVMGAAPAPLTF